MMSEQQRETRWTGGAVLDMAARWLRARGGLRRVAGAGEHAHWDPVNRTWHFHVHRADRPARRS